jgi:HSP20 family protein
MTQDDPFESMQREVQRLFHDLVYHRHPATHFGEPSWKPSADLVVTESTARVIIELAGVPRENVRVRLHGNLLEISGRRDPPPRPHGARYHRAEIYFGDFRRLIELPWTADENRVTAKYRDGMLEIHLACVQETRRAVVRVASAVGLKRRAR